MEAMNKEKRQAIKNAWHSATSGAATPDRLAALISETGPIMAWRNAQAGDGKWGVEMCIVDVDRPRTWDITVTPVRAPRPEYDNEDRAIRAAREMARVAGGFDLSECSTTLDIASRILVNMRLRDALSERVLVTEHPRDRLIQYLSAHGPVSVWRARRYREFRWYRGAVDRHLLSLIDGEPVIGTPVDVGVVPSVAAHLVDGVAYDMAHKYGGVSCRHTILPGRPITDIEAAGFAVRFC